MLKCYLIQKQSQGKRDLKALIMSESIVEPLNIIKAMRLEPGETAILAYVGEDGKKVTCTYAGSPGHLHLVSQTETT